MMIKITEKCSMGCTHCMNRATPEGKSMNFPTFQKAIDFQRKYGGPFCIITGGEPTERTIFMNFLNYAIDGHIKLGESDLCPNCSHINKKHNEIIKDILDFRCKGCKHINDNLDDMYKKIIGED